jgi:hypothetical protein
LQLNPERMPKAAVSAAGVEPGARLSKGFSQWVSNRTRTARNSRAVKAIRVSRNNNNRGKIRIKSVRAKIKAMRSAMISAASQRLKRSHQK